MGGYYGTSGMWYHKGTFYELDNTHVNFFLNNPEKLGFSQKEKEEMCVANGLSPDAKSCDEQSQIRVNIVTEVLKRGNIRIRFYGGKTSVQCYDFKNNRDAKELKNCVIDGYGKCFGSILTVMDCFGWGEQLNDMGWGPQIKDFIASSKHKQKYVYINNNEFKSLENKEMKNIKSNGGRVLEGEEKNKVLREALKQQGYSDGDIAVMLGQSKKPVKSGAMNDTYDNSEFNEFDDFGDDRNFRRRDFYEADQMSDDEYANCVAKDAYDEHKENVFNSKKSIKSVRVVKDMNFRDFEPWSGAKETYDIIMGEGKDDVMDAYLDEIYPDGLTDTELNDMLWFDKDSILEYLGIGQETYETYEPIEDEENDHYSNYPRYGKREGLEQARKTKKSKKKVTKKNDKKKKKALKSGYNDDSDEASDGYYDETMGEKHPQESEGRVIEGEEKNEILREVLKQQGYSDGDISAMLSQSRKNEKKTIKSSAEDGQNTWRGVPGVRMIWHGEWADPDLAADIDGVEYTFNYWDIEDALWGDFCERNNVDDSRSGDSDIESKFDEYCRDEALSYLKDVVDGGYFKDGSTSWHDK